MKSIFEVRGCHSSSLHLTAVWSRKRTDTAHQSSRSQQEKQKNPTLEREIILFKQAAEAERLSGIPPSSPPMVFNPLVSSVLYKRSSHPSAPIYRWHETTQEPSTFLCCSLTCSKGSNTIISASLEHEVLSAQLFPAGSAYHWQIRKISSPSLPEQLKGISAIIEKCDFITLTL